MTWANSSDAFSSDHNGFRPNKGVAEQYHWLGPAKGQNLYEPKPEDWWTFATLAEFRAATGQETHGLEVTFEIVEGIFILELDRRLFTLAHDHSLPRHGRLRTLTPGCFC